MKRAIGFLSRAPGCPTTDVARPKATADELRFVLVSPLESEGSAGMTKRNALRRHAVSAISLLAVTGATALLAAPSRVDAFSTRPCSGSYARQAPGAVLLGDRLRAAGGTSCRYARYLVRLFLRVQAMDVKCA